MESESDEFIAGTDGEHRDVVAWEEQSARPEPDGLRGAWRKTPQNTAARSSKLCEMNQGSHRSGKSGNSGKFLKTFSSQGNQGKTGGFQPKSGEKIWNQGVIIGKTLPYKTLPGVFPLKILSGKTPGRFLNWNFFYQMRNPPPNWKNPPLRYCDTKTDCWFLKKYLRFI